MSALVHIEQHNSPLIGPQPKNVPILMDSTLNKVPAI